MSTADRTGQGRSAAETGALDALLRLAAKGAHAAPMDATLGAAGPFGVFSPRDGYAQAVATVPGSAVGLACRRGWLVPTEAAGHYRIAAAGIEVLRRAKCGGSTNAAAGRTRSKAANRAAPQAAAVTRAAQEGPLAWLRRRKDKGGQALITEPQFAAGERLGADFWHAQLMPRVTANWSAAAASRRMRRAAPGAGVDISDNVVAARARVHRALAAVGPELAGILLDVCCHDIGLEPAGRAQGWPQRAAKVVLQLGLTRLARHYGLLAPEPSPGAHRLRHWGGEDYRPTLDAWRS
jgi:hypothetical protein